MGCMRSPSHRARTRRSLARTAHHSRVPSPPAAAAAAPQVAPARFAHSRDPHLDEAPTASGSSLYTRQCAAARRVTAPHPADAGWPCSAPPTRRRGRHPCCHLPPANLHAHHGASHRSRTPRRRSSRRSAWRDPHGNPHERLALDAHALPMPSCSAPSRPRPPRRPPPPPPLCTRRGPPRAPPARARS